jgi:hypothetical protein
MNTEIYWETFSSAVALRKNKDLEEYVSKFKDALRVGSNGESFVSALLKIRP